MNCKKKLINKRMTWQIDDLATGCCIIHSLTHYISRALYYVCIYFYIWTYILSKRKIFTEIKNLYIVLPGSNNLLFNNIIRLSYSN